VNLSSLTHSAIARSRKIASKLSASVADQALLSVGNLAMSVVLARETSLSAFGAFGLVFAFYLLAIGCQRAFIGEALLIRNESSGGQNSREEAKAVLGLSLAGSAFVTALSLFVGGVADGYVRIAFISFGLILPAVLMQDTARYLFFSSGRTSSVLKADILLLTLQFSGYAVLVLVGEARLELLILWWGVSALVSLIAQLTTLKAVPTIRIAAGWARSHRDLSPRFLGEYLTLAGLQQGTVFLIGAIAGLSDVGNYRAAQVVLGPLNIVTMGAAVVVLPYAAQLARKNLPALPRFAASVSAVMAAVATMAVACVFLIPDSLGDWLLGESWQGGSALVPLVGLALIANNLSYGATSGLRGMEFASRSLRARLFMAPVTVFAVVVGSWSGGVVGALIGLAIGAFFQTGIWWWLFVASHRDRSGNSDGPEVDISTGQRGIQ